MGLYPKRELELVFCVSGAQVTSVPFDLFFWCGPFFKYLFIYLFMAVWGLRFCVRAFSSCDKQGPLFIAVLGPLTIAASLVAEHRLQMRRLSNCGSRAQLLRGMWDLPRPRLEPVSPALAGRFSTTAPPGKPHLTSYGSLQSAVNWWLSTSLSVSVTLLWLAHRGFQCVVFSSV